MRIYHLLLLNVLAITGSVNADSPHEVTFRKLSKTDDDYEINVNLKRIHSHLANEHLPVFVIDAEDHNDLKQLKNVMKDIGPVHMYQDTQSCSAAVYFHNGQYFDGTIDQSHSVKQVLYDSINHEALITERNLYPSRTADHPEIDLDQTSSIHSDVEIKHGKSWKYVKSRIDDPETVYIETLVMVNHDLVNVFRNNHDKIVSDILVTMNSVDMLFSRIDSPRIRINIAGIIIGNSHESFPLVQKKCHKSSRQMNVLGFNADCLSGQIQLTLDGYRETIPLNSYDIVIFLTNFMLYDFQRDAKGKIVAEEIKGLAHPSFIRNDYIGYSLSSNNIPVGIVQQFDIFAHFPVIAHEMAHLFNVFHDPGKFRSSYGKCIGNLMRTDGRVCKKCLFFSDNSQEQMKKFFISRDGCKFRNEPRSLNHPSKPQLFWNQHEQCRCYGFEKARTPQRVECAPRERLICLNIAHRIFKTGFFFDGTPCNTRRSDNMVCWKGNCKTVMN